MTFPAVMTRTLAGRPGRSSSERRPRRPSGLNARRWLRSGDVSVLPRRPCVRPTKDPLPRRPRAYCLRCGRRPRGGSEDAPGTRLVDRVRHAARLAGVDSFTVAVYGDLGDSGLWEMHLLVGMPTVVSLLALLWFLFTVPSPRPTVRPGGWSPATCPPLPARRNPGVPLHGRARVAGVRVVPPVAGQAVVGVHSGALVMTSYVAFIQAEGPDPCRPRARGGLPRLGSADGVHLCPSGGRAAGRADLSTSSCPPPPPR